MVEMGWWKNPFMFISDKILPWRDFFLVEICTQAMMIMMLDSIAVSVFAYLIEFNKYWDSCGNPSGAGVKSLKGLISLKTDWKWHFLID